MVIKEGIVLCKRTRELVGFEDLNISPELTTEPENFNDNEEVDRDSSSESTDSQLSSPPTRNMIPVLKLHYLLLKNLSHQKSKTCLSVLFFIIRRGLFLASCLLFFTQNQPQNSSYLCLASL